MKEPEQKEPHEAGVEAARKLITTWMGDLSVAYGTPGHSRRKLADRIAAHTDAAVKEIREENTRLAKEHTEVHVWNDKLVHEHYELGDRIRDLTACLAERPPDMCQCGRSSSDAVGDVFQDHESTCAVYLHAKVRVMAEAQGQLIAQRDDLTTRLAAAESERDEWKAQYDGLYVDDMTLLNLVKELKAGWRATRAERDTLQAERDRLAKGEGT